MVRFATLERLTRSNKCPFSDGMATIDGRNVLRQLPKILSPFMVNRRMREIALDGYFSVLNIHVDSSDLDLYTLSWNLTSIHVSYQIKGYPSVSDLVLSTRYRRDRPRFGDLASDFFCELPGKRLFSIDITPILPYIKAINIDIVSGGGRMMDLEDMIHPGSRDQAATRFRRLMEHGEAVVGYMSRLQSLDCSLQPETYGDRDGAVYYKEAIIKMRRLNVSRKALWAQYHAGEKEKLVKGSEKGVTEMAKELMSGEVLGFKL